MITYAAYNSAPADLHEDDRLEDRWYGLLRSEELIGGLELCFDATLHPRGPEHLSKLLSPEWTSVVTNIPGTLRNGRGDPSYGLASIDESSRQQAILDVKTLYQQVTRLQQSTGAQAVRAVELQSAPRAVGNASSAASLADSLTEIASWNWGAIQLSLEHADALVASHAPEKGFLSLEEEYRSTSEASIRSGRRVKQNLNWARSAIEARSTSGPTAHLTYLATRDNLCGLVFSGVSPLALGAKHPWQDSHVPIDDVEPSSLLSAGAIEECFSLLNGTVLDFIGVKVNTPVDPKDLADRLRPGLATLREVNRVMSGRAR